MTATTETTGTKKRLEWVMEKLNGGLVRAFLIVVGLFWLVPTIGLLISSLRSPRT